MQSVADHPQRAQILLPRHLILRTEIKLLQGLSKAIRNGLSVDRPGSVFIVEVKISWDQNQNEKSLTKSFLEVVHVIRNAIWSKFSLLCSYFMGIVSQF